MDFITSLQQHGDKDLALLESRFRKIKTAYNRGVSKVEFVSYFLELYPEDLDLEAKTVELISLFERIDVNGLNYVKWNSFTRYFDDFWAIFFFNKQKNGF